MEGQLSRVARAFFDAGLRDCGSGRQQVSRARVFAFSVGDRWRPQGGWISAVRGDTPILKAAAAWFSCGCVQLSWRRALVAERRPGARWQHGVRSDGGAKAATLGETG